MIAMSLPERVERRLPCQVLKGGRGVDQTPVEEYPSRWTIGRGSAIGNGERNGAPRKGGSICPWEGRAVTRQLLPDDPAAWLFHGGVTPSAELRQERRLASARATGDHDKTVAVHVSLFIAVHVSLFKRVGRAGRGWDSPQSSGKEKTAHGDAIPRSKCVPSAINGASVSAASAPDTRTAFPSGRHSPSSRLTRLTAEPIAVKSRRSAALILPHSISPRCRAAPKGSGGSPCRRRSSSRCAIPARAADTACKAASQAARGAPTTGKIANTPSPTNFSTSPPKA